MCVCVPEVAASFDPESARRGNIYISKARERTLFLGHVSVRKSTYISKQVR